MEDHFTPGLIIGVIIGAFITAVSIFSNDTDHNTAYAKGITDCRSGKVSYTVTVGPEGVDTTYTYKP